MPLPQLFSSPAALGIQDLLAGSPSPGPTLAGRPNNKQPILGTCPGRLAQQSPLGRCPGNVSPTSSDLVFPPLSSVQIIPKPENQKENLEQRLPTLFKKGRRKTVVRNLGKMIYYSKVKFKFQHCQVKLRHLFGGDFSAQGWWDPAGLGREGQSWEMALVENSLGSAR